MTCSGCCCCDCCVRVQTGKAYCLRVRMDMTADNKCLRDPVAYRCNDHPHWRTGTTFKCYPTYDYACPFVDAAQGVTHALRTSEYKDREEQFQRILAMMRAADAALPAVHIWDYSRLNFVHTGALHTCMRLGRQGVRAGGSCRSRRCLRPRPCCFRLLLWSCAASGPVPVKRAGRALRRPAWRAAG